MLLDTLKGIIFYILGIAIIFGGMALIVFGIYSTTKTILGVIIIFVGIAVIIMGKKHVIKI